MALPTTNLVARWKADAGVTETGLGISTWADQTANGNDLTQTTDANRPSLETDQEGLACVYFDGSENFVFGSGLSIDKRNTTIYVCQRFIGSGTDVMVDFTGHVITCYTAASVPGNNAAIRSEAAGATTDVKLGNGIDAICWSWGAAGSAVYAGPESDTHSAASAGTVNSGEVGTYVGQTLDFNGYIYEILIYNDEHDAAARQAVFEYLADTYGAVAHNEDTAIIAEGDSLTAGFGLTSPAEENWAHQLVYNSDLPSQPKYWNDGVSGDTVQAMITQTAVAGYITASAAYTNKVVILFAGTNDINGGRTEAQVEGDLDTWVTNAKTNGATHVVVCTILPRGNFDAAEEAIRVAVNSHITAGNTGADAVVDLAADARLDDETDTTYYQGDAIHLTNAGQAVVAELVLASLIADNILDYTPPTITGTYTVAVGETKDLTVTGTGFIDGVAASSTDAGFTVNSETWVSATEVTVNVTGVTAGTYTNDLVLTNPDGQTATGTVRVLASTTYDGTDNFVRAGAWYPLKLRNGGTFRFRG